MDGKKEVSTSGTGNTSEMNPKVSDIYTNLITSIDELFSCNEDDNEDSQVEIQPIEIIKTKMQHLGFECAEKIYKIEDFVSDENAEQSMTGIKKLSSNVNKGIYVFAIQFSEEHTYDKFKDIWEKRSKEKVPRLNDAISSNQYLYIGRAWSGLSSRIKSHLGKGSDSTYALKLGRLESIGNYGIQCHIFTIDPKKIAKDIQVPYISMIETILHEKCKPIVGKK